MDNTQNPYLKIQWIRWVLLLFLCLAEAANTSALEIPSALQIYLQSKDMKLTTVEYNIFFTITYSSLAIGTISFGYFVNLIGPLNALLGCLFCHLAAGLIFLAGILLDNVYILYFSRIFSGIGECNYMCYAVLIDVWFHNKELSMGFSILSSFGRTLAYVLNYTIPLVREGSGSIDYTIVYSVALTFLFIILTFILKRLDAQYVEKVEFKEEDAIMAGTFKEYFSKTITNLKLLSKNFKFMLILISVANILCHKHIFIYNYNELLHKVYGHTSVSAAKFSIVSFVVAFVFSVFFSYCIFDRCGQRLWGLLFADVNFFLSYILMAFLPEELSNIVYISFFFYGIGNSLQQCTQWPCCNSLINRNLISSGVGFVYFIYAVTMSIVSLLYGVIRDNTKTNRNGFFWASNFLAIICFVSLFSSGYSLWLNWKTGGCINKANIRGDNLLQESMMVKQPDLRSLNIQQN